MRKISLNPQTLLVGILILVWIIFGLVNPAILSVANGYSLLRAAIIPLMLALPQMLIIARGGIDMSFTVIAAISSYITLYGWEHFGSADTSIIWLFIVSIIIGIICYCVNWFFVEKARIPIFIATLGVHSLLKGFVLAFVSTSYVNVLPNSLKRLSTATLATAQNIDGVESVLHVSIIFVIVLYVLMHLMMEKTVFGRELYAIGVDEDAAKRAGIDVGRVSLYCFIIAGVICGITGILHDSLSRFSMPLPTDVVGKELNSIAAVVIGIGGSKKASGIVVGTFLGVLLLQTISTNLVMLGVPSYWQQLVSGVIILAGLGFQAFQSNRKAGR